MQLLLSVVLGLSILSPIAQTTEDAFSQHLYTHLPRLLDRYRVPGVTVALVENGQLIWSEGFGIAEPESVFQVASISKPVTALGVMRLVEDGLVSLDSPVNRYLSRWQIPDGRYDSDAVTIRMLLSHTGGLSLAGYPGLEPGRTLPSLRQSLDGDTGGAGDVHLLARPGSRFVYSGGGYTVLQLLIEEVSGQDFASYMETKIFHPLGMEDSSFRQEVADWSTTLPGHGYYGRPLPTYQFAAQAAAGLYSTSADLGLFTAAMMQIWNDEVGDGGLLSAASAQEMLTAAENTGGAYGLGYSLTRMPSGALLASHGGGNRGWKSLMALLPEQASAIVILTNSDRGHWLIDEVISDWVFTRTGDKIGRPANLPISLAVLVLTALLGISLYKTFRRMRLGELVMRTPGQFKTAWKRYAGAASMLSVTTLWLVSWYSDALLRYLRGIEHIVPITLASRELHSFTMVLVGWSLFGTLRMLFIHAPKTTTVVDSKQVS